MDWPTFSLVGRTFTKVFPNSLLLVAKPSTEGGDYLLVGFKGKNRMALDHAKPKISYAARSKNLFLTNPELLFRLIVSEDLKSLFGRGPINTDSRPRLEFAAPMLINRYDPTIRKKIMTGALISKETENIVRQVTSDIDSQIDFAAYALSVHEPFQNMIDLRKTSPLQKDRFFSLVENYCENSILDESLIKDDEIMRRCRLVQMKTIKDHIDQLPNKALSYAYLAELHLKEGLLADAVMYYLKSLEIQPQNAAAHNDLGVALMQLDREKEALRHFKEALRIDPEHASALDNIEYVMKKQGKM
jgi:tetratricopeptide (TPR) repeat protein